MKHPFLILIALLCLSCSKISDKLPGKQSAAEQSIAVEVISVGSNANASTHTYVGELKASEEMSLHYPLGGELIALHVRNGENVKEGQLLAEIDDTQAKSLHDAAMAVLKQAEDGYERLQKVHSEGGIADVKWVEMQTNLEKARQNEIATRKNLNDCHLKAPYDGVASKINVHVGQQLMPGQSVVTIMNMRSLEADFSVPEQDVQRLQVGQEVDICISAIGNRMLSGKIIEKSLSANPVAHTYTIRASVKGSNSDGLLPGMVCKVNVSESANEGIILPGECVQTTPQGPAVWVVTDGTVERRHITAERYVKDGILVSGGLQYGEQVVIAGYQKLYNGAKVVVN